MKIPFDIKYRPQIESGEYKVVTRDGNPVRIICWDRKNDHYKIIALVTIEDGEIDFSFTEKGVLLDSSTPQPIDLFIIIPKSELTELERAIKRGMLCASLEGVSTTIIKETAKEVKDIICRGCTIGSTSGILLGVAILPYGLMDIMAKNIEENYMLHIGVTHSHKR